MYKSSLTLCTVLFLSFSLFAQQNFFTDAGANRVMTTNGQRLIIPQQYRASSLDISGIKSFLWSLPSERSILNNRNQAPVILLPMPDGTVARFRVWESSIMDPVLAAKFPEIRTFAGQGIDDPYASIRLDFNPYFGFHAQVLSAATGRFFIDPYARGDVNNYISYYARDHYRAMNVVCEIPEEAFRDPGLALRVAAGPCRGTTLKTYRLALACTGEYSVAVAGANPTKPAVLAAMVTSVNRVTGVYETEVAVRLQLIANNEDIIYLDGASDPYTNSSGSTMLIQNQTNLDNVIGTANYDVGHVFSTGGGGIATLNSPCNPSTKARGVTGLSNPVGDGFDIDYVAHEMGHQFGAPHTFNSVTGSCSGNRSSTDAYEVGSATTIMGYAGICGSDNIQPNSDPFFHTISFDRIGNFVENAGGATCGVATPTGNAIPIISSMENNGVNIPISTPFTLTATASDPNGDAITYCWEEWDLGPATAWNGGNNNTSSPLFKSRVPKTSGSRTFPDMAVILANYPAAPAATMGGLKGETLPTLARTMKFRLTVRDNRAGGGGVTTGGDGCNAGFTGMFQVNTIATSGPFAVTVPNGGEIYAGGSSQTITWNVVGTDAAPISVSHVRILLSTDGGLTYPTVLSASTPNDGSELLALPAITTTTARVKVEALGNIFFDISNANFTLTPPPSGFEFDSPAPAVSACPAGPSMAITLGTTSNGGFSNPITLSATGNPPGTTVTFSPNPVTPGSSSTVTLNGTNTLGAGSYVITVTGVATGTPNRTRDLTYTITPGAGPAITGQPTNQAICTGTNTSFTVVSATATGFQWQLSTDGGVNYTNISNGGVYSGATTATLAITGATSGMNNYRYRAIASVLCGSTTSNAAVLTVNAAPAITTQPQSITLCAGSNHTFTVAATGAGLSYQWELSTDGGGTFNPIPGATVANYNLVGITAGMNNYHYRVVITGLCPPAVTSVSAILTVVTSVAVTSQPTDATVCVGANTSFTVAGSGSGVIYQWQLSTDGGGVFTNLTNGGVYSGATAATLNITGATATMNGYKYRALLTNSTCTTPGVSDTATLTVNTLPAITANPQSATICLASNNTFSVTASGTGISYQWQLSTNGGTTWGDIAGANTSTYTVNNVTAGMNANQYRVIVSGTCPPQAFSAAATLTVINPVAVTTHPANSEVCSGSNATFSVTGNSTQTISYQWQVSTDGGTTWNNVTGATASSYTVNNTTTALSGNRYRVQLSNTTCTSPTTSNAATLTVRQLPTVGLTAPVASLSPGQTTTLTATPSASTGGTLSVSWTYNNNPLTVTGNTYVVNVEKVGAYKVRIQETWPSTLVCATESQVVTLTAPASNRLFIFPSPNDGQFTVSYYNASGNTVQRTITVYDARGARVYSGKFPVTGAYTLLPVNIKPAAKGIYYVYVGDAFGKKIAVGSVVVH